MKCETTIKITKQKGWLICDTLANASNFEEALDMLSMTKIMAPVYLYFRWQ